MSHKSRITSKIGSYYSLKSIQALNIHELRSLENSSVTPPNHQGFFCKCVESFKVNYPKIRQWAENLFYEPVEPQGVTGNE